ncbi:hypothetical protein B0H15DRAFT_924963 [Mycena belliarum]|uniref:Methyltransferase ausD n=1 Tax=Mycena belliarum TaxID=1033014 RepID=A0AAD6XKY1_9AGAR|nr:hypothetical protein B0H15DRAFT_924963 [Mycena belliae]
MAAYTPAVIDEDLYKPEQFELVKAQTGIQDPGELKKHILAVQAKAYDLLSYPCIRRFEFATPRISTYPAYKHVLAMGRERPGAILLDVGCCFGTDIRQAASDGFPRQNLIASDLRSEFWSFGHELFRSTPETFPVPFIAGDVLDPDFLEPREPLLTEPGDINPALTSLANLTPLHGHVAAIHISLVFHLFLEPKQLQLARALAGLLSPVPGSVILGSHVGLQEKGFREGLCIAGHSMFCHSPQSWREMWETVFPKGSIEVEAEIHRRASDTPDAGVLVWSVTRV